MSADPLGGLTMIRLSRGVQAVQKAVKVGDGDGRRPSAEMKERIKTDRAFS